MPIDLYNLVSCNGGTYLQLWSICSKFSIVLSVSALDGCWSHSLSECSMNHRVAVTLGVGYLLGHNSFSGVLDGTDHMLLDKTQSSGKVLFEPYQIYLRLFVLGLQ